MLQFELQRHKIGATENSTMRRSLCLLCILPALPGCLATWNPFEEEAFIQDYSDSLCDIYLDCQDGVRDYQWISSASVFETASSQCDSWTRSAFDAQCAIESSAAMDCYDQVSALSLQLAGSDNCENLWSTNALSNCKSVYPACDAANEFGTVPPQDIDPPEITSIHPKNGNRAGGNEVTITGGVFDDATTVKFGGILADLISQSEDTLVVITPPNASSSVDVTVTNEGGSAALPGGFTLWPDRTDKSGIFGYYIKKEWQGVFWDERPDDSVFAGAYLVADTLFAYDNLNYYKLYGLFSTLDTCVVDTVLDGGNNSSNWGLSLIPSDYQALTLEPSTGSSLELLPDGQGFSLQTLMDPRDFEYNRRYTMLSEASEGVPLP